MRKNISKARAFAATNKASGRGPHRVSGTGKRRLVPSAGLACMLFAGGLIPATANAGFVVTVEQSGQDVIVSYTGAWETWTTASSFDPTTSRALLGNHTLRTEIAGTVEFALTDVELISGGWTSASTAETFTVTGDIFGFDIVQGVVFAPSGYTANTTLSGSFTYFNSEFSVLGLTDGDAGVFDAGDYGQISFSVGAADPNSGGGSVPEPSSLALLGCGAVVMGLRRWPLRSRGNHRARA